MQYLHSTQPPRRPWADRLGLRRYLGDLVARAIRRDPGDAPDVHVFANCIEQDLGNLTRH